MARPLNRTGNEVRKQADEERVVDERSRGLQFALVDIDDVGNFLKCIKRDPGRKQDAQHQGGRVMKPERLQSCRERIDEEVEVLEHAEKAEVDEQRHRQQRPPAAHLI